MITRLLDFVTGREPVATATGIAAVITAGLGLGAAFGLAITVEQIAAIGALAAALAGWAARRAVTPVAGPTERQERGSVPLAAIILIVVVFLILGGVFASCDALFEDESEPGDLGLPALVADHDCYEYDCGGSDGNTGYDGEGGRSGDMDQGGDDNCRNFCDNIIYIPGTGGGEEQPRV